MTRVDALMHKVIAPVSSFTKNDACKASNPNKRAESGKGKKKDGRGVEIVPLLENAQTKTMVYSVVAKNGKHRPCRLWKGGSSKRFRSTLADWILYALKLVDIEASQVILEDKVDMVMSRDNEFPQ
ncbi:hypothetical protein V6N12_011416 [Hibiscus sabdariffa]|uniref:Uncharacterized protein n=1 Tax=Hibiscus sabdariffa TaxID=183260 RepID=A0ABR2AW18_9ROSI